MCGTLAQRSAPLTPRKERGKVFHWYLSRVEWVSSKILLVC